MLIAAIRTTLEGWDVVVALLVCAIVVVFAAAFGRRVTPAPGPSGYWWPLWLLVVTLFAVVMFGLALTVRW